MKITWLGHSGFRIELGTAVLLVLILVSDIVRRRNAWRSR